MIKKVAIGIAIILAILLIISLIPQPQPSSPKQSVNKMVEFALEDAKDKFPNATVSLVAVFPLNAEECKQMCVSGSNGTLIIVKAVYWKTPLCPVRYHIRYIFPYRGFSNLPPEPIVNDCSLCKNKPCKITLEEEAVIASVNVNGTEEVRKFALKNNAKPKVLDKDGSKIWHVIWRAGNTYYTVVLNENGSLLEVKKHEG